MAFDSWLQFACYLGVLLALAKPLGDYMGRVYQGQSTANRLIAPIERFIYRLSGVRPDHEMRWTDYAFAFLWFNLSGALFVYGLQRLQEFLPLNPRHLAGVSPDSAFNTAISFASNTDWQAYSGEETLSYLTQMLGLTVLNFTSAASGMAVLVAVIRGFARQHADTLGNFWVDSTRTILCILLPLSILFAVLLVGQGVVQTFAPYQTVSLLEDTFYEGQYLNEHGEPIQDSLSSSGTRRILVTEQTLALGPVASQVAIKQLGTNGGGFFGVNSAHPFENPTPLSNFLEMLAILLIPAALCHTFGRMVMDSRQGWAILAAMTLVFVALVPVVVTAEQAGNPALSVLGADQTASIGQAGGNMEGKETRFGITNSALWAVATSAASNGSVNSMHDSFTPLGGLIPLWLMQLGEVIYGGAGSGLYGMILFAIIAVFIAGLMIGRTPQYLGKKIEAYEMKMASIAILIPPMLVLSGTAIAVMADPGRASVANPGPHGFSEILYAFSSAGNNNGSAFAGLSANNPFYNLLLGAAMWFGRYGVAVPTLAIAGALAAKKIVPPGAGTLATHAPMFVALLIGVVILVGALTFIPALALGPVVEHLGMVGVK
ncbi:MAG: potassium-transporting ATPase subunit KdpA [Methylococcaceae bacterium]|nr:potassium-transporting ATPase subunit KdpA [Methylococcaceae bacterium]